MNTLEFIIYSVVFCDFSQFHSEAFFSSLGFIPCKYGVYLFVLYFIIMSLISTTIMHFFAPKICMGGYFLLMGKCQNGYNYYYTDGSNDDNMFKM